MVLLSTMSYFDRIIMSIVGPSIVKEFSLSETEMGAIYSAFILSYAVLMIPGGALADHLGARMVISVSALGAALFTGLTALVGEPGLATYWGVVPSFLALRLGFGATTAPLYPSCAKMNANWMPPSQRARVWGWIASGAGIGGALSPILFASMIDRYGWHKSFWIAGVATAVLGTLWFLYVRDYPPGRIRSGELNKTLRTPTPWRKLLANRDLLLLTGSYFGVAYFEYIFFYWLFYYFGEIRHMGTNQSAIYVTAVWLAWVVMTPVGGWVSDRLVARYGRGHGRRLVCMIGLISSAIFLCVGLNLTEPVAIATAMCLSLGLAASSDGSYWASAIEAGGEHVGAAGSVLNTGGNAGGFLAPVLTAYVASHIGWSWALYLGAFIVIIAAVTWQFIGLESIVPKQVDSRPSI
jgi:ACS family glucarate transporter-like MFS transporter